ncbi:MAG: DUF4337 family protein [Candidatus Xenobia bacterium]
MAEQMEHAGHAGNLGKYIGITMAVLGVFLAVCSALVGGERTELIARMVEQTAANLRHQAVSTKYCMVQANLVQLHALMPDPKTYAEQVKQAQDIRGHLKSGGNAQKLALIAELGTARILNTVVPTHEDMLSFVEQLEKLDEQAEAAREWAESYEPAIDAHSEAAEHYEWGQLCAEIGIVVCSVALLLSNKPMWLISILLGTLCVIIVCITAMQTTSMLGSANGRISSAESKYNDLSKNDTAGDKKLWEEIRKEKPMNFDPDARETPPTTEHNEQPATGERGASGTEHHGTAAHE